MRQWVTKRYQADLQKIAERYQISDIVAEVLVKRGLFDWNAMDRYLFPDEDALYDTAQMKDMQKAAFILRQKIDEGKLIKVIGDYDVDGVMSTYILYRGITLLGVRQAIGFHIGCRMAMVCGVIWQRKPQKKGMIRL